MGKKLDIERDLKMNSDLTPSEYMNLMLRRQEQINREYEEFITQAIIFCKIDITDIPVNIMLLSPSIYISVFRIARGSDCKKAVGVFKAIIDEYEDVSKDEKFMECLSFFLYHCDRIFGEKQEYQSFRASIPKEILDELEE